MRRHGRSSQQCRVDIKQIALPQRQVIIKHNQLPPSPTFLPSYCDIIMAAAPSALHPRSSRLALLAAAALLITCAGFSIGLTFAPCHSSICVEHWFPSQTRIHIAVFYGSIGILAICLVARSESQTIRLISDRYISDKPIPLLGAWISISGLLTSVWVIAFTLASTAYWFPPEHAFWLARGSAAGWTQYMFRVTWAGVTGHWCDVWFGLVFLPVGRDSVLSDAFGVQSSTLLFAHKILAYTLCAFGLIHGLLYYVRYCKRSMFQAPAIFVLTFRQSFLAAWVANATIEPISAAFNPDNPFYTWKQVEQLGIYGWFVLPTGAAAGIVLIPTMLIAALPIIRRKNYNVFYYIHIIFAVLVLVLLCLHASTNFYFVLPGLLLWVYDWAHRLRRALFYRKAISVENAGNGWYRMRLLHIGASTASDISDAEKALSVREATAKQEHPLETYYIRLRSISAIQIHPFTAVAPASSSSGPVLLFQKSPEKKKAIASAAEWTWKLGAMVDTSASPKTAPVILEVRRRADVLVYRIIPSANILSRHA